MTSERGFLSSAMVKIEREENALENWIWESWVRYFLRRWSFRVVEGLGDIGI